jgi:L-ascorbate metabolism protein UlaG (beta-lactamase superfamily)
MKATFLGHAAVYAETGNTKIIVNPFLTGNPKAPVKADEGAKIVILEPGENVEVSEREKTNRR